MAATRTAKAVWENDLLHGHGSVQGTSGALPSVPVSWAARDGGAGRKSSPEELLAAAHASCFSMALSAGLGRMQKPPSSSRSARLRRSTRSETVGRSPRWSSRSWVTYPGSPKRSSPRRRPPPAPGARSRARSRGMLRSRSWRSSRSPYVLRARSANTNPSRSTTGPATTGIGRSNIGPACDARVELSRARHTGPLAGARPEGSGSGYDPRGIGGTRRGSRVTIRASSPWSIISFREGPGRKPPQRKDGLDARSPSVALPETI